MVRELHIAYVGCPLSGRSTSLHRIADRCATTVTAIDVGGKGVVELVVATPSLVVRARAGVGSAFVPDADRALRAWADAFVLVVDSQADRAEANEAIIEEVLFELGERPLVLQYNKRDLPNVLSRDELDRLLNWRRFRAIESSAVAGDAGAWEAFQLLIDRARVSS
jgi:hypothetical protein